MIAYIHIVFALLAFVFGVVQLVRPKGTCTHVVLGRCWMGFMAATSVSSFWLRDLRGGDFSWIHLLSVWTLFCLVVAIHSARRQNIQRHKRFAIGAYIGLVVAGVAATLMPNRLIYTWLFG